MNQILYTGGKNRKNPITSTQKIIIFFVVFIIIFAICAIALGVNLTNKVQNGDVANIKPGVNGSNTNQGTNDNNTNTPSGTTEPKDYITITFASELGGVKINVESLTDAKIKTISYWWEEEEKTTLEVSDTKYEETITAKSGTHYLYVQATDENGNQKDAKQLVIGVGDSEPEVTIATDGVSNYVVKVKDEERITKVEVTLNGQLETIEVNDKEYEYVIAVPEGDSLIEVKAYNLSGASTIKKAKVTNFGG